MIICPLQHDIVNILLSDGSEQSRTTIRTLAHLPTIININSVFVAIEPAPEAWPHHIVNSLMDFKYSDRICVTNFFSGDGLTMNNAFDTICFYHSCKRATQGNYKYTFTQLWKRLEDAVNRRR